MLTGNFFELAAVNNTAGKIIGLVQFNAAHSIFEGHFPGQPVVPGVCMMQMVKEILQQVMKVSARLEKADLVKFLTVINPVETKSVQVELACSGIENEQVKISATLFNQETVYFKMRGTYRVLTAIEPAAGA